MTGPVERAEKRGLLQRAPHAVDGRGVEVVISADGAALADRLYDQVAASLVPVTGRLTPAEQRRLQTLLVRMLAAAALTGTASARGATVGRVGLEPTTEGL